MFWVDPAKIEKVIVNEGKGKKIEAYYIKDMDVNLQSLNVTADEDKLSYTHQQDILIILMSTQIQLKDMPLVL